MDRLGIDKITLYGFKVIKMKEVDFELKIENKKTTHYLNDTFFKLTVSENIEDNLISFNPNKILFGNNILNSRGKELKEAFDVLKKILDKKQIIIDFEESKIFDIEINFNIREEYSDFYEVNKFLAQRLNKHSETYDNKNFISACETIYSKNTVFKLNIYNKTVQINNKNILDYPLIRYEFLFFKKTYKDFLSKNLNFKNDFNTLLNKTELIDYLFLHYFNKFLIKRSKKRILEIERFITNKYVNFLNSNKLARETGRKQSRGVYAEIYRELRRNNFEETFCFTILKQLTKEHNTINFSRELKRLKNSFIEDNNDTKFDFLSKFFLLH